jgi:NADH-quinone oxidoreductase subunit E
VSPAVPRFAHGSRVPGWDDAVDLDKDPATIPDLAVTPVPEALRVEIQAAMAKYPDRRSAAIPALHAAQARHGWCSPEAIDQVASVMRLTPAYLSSVATFYDMLENEPRPVHHDVYVCTNITCSMLGGDELLEEMVAASGENPSIHVRGFECLGACDIAPMASVDGEYIGPLQTADAVRIVEDLQAGRDVLSEKNIRYRQSVDPDVQPEADEFHPPEHAERTDTAGLSEADRASDRPGPSAPIETLPDEARGDEDEDT